MENTAERAKKVLYEAVKRRETVTNSQGVWGRRKPVDGGSEESLN